MLQINFSHTLGPIAAPCEGKISPCMYAKLRLFFYRENPRRGSPSRPLPLKPQTYEPRPTFVEVCDNVHT